MQAQKIRDILVTFTTNDVAPDTWHAHVHLPTGIATTSQRHFPDAAAWRESWERLIDAAVGPTPDRQLAGVDGEERPWWPAPDGTTWVRVHKPRGLRWQPIDHAVADIVTMLHDSRAVTSTASCGGHETAPGHVLMDDGRVLAVLPDLETFELLTEYARAMDLFGWGSVLRSQAREHVRYLKTGAGRKLPPAG